MRKNLQQFSNNDVNIIKEEILHQGFLRLVKYHINHRLFKGGWSTIFTREIFLRHCVAAALLYDPKQDNVVLLEQFRPGALKDEHSPWLLEIVAGINDTKKSLNTLILQEIKEESGLETSKLIPIYKYWVSPGGSNEYLALYCAIVDADKAGKICGIVEEHEDIKVHVINRQEAFNMLSTGEINNAVTIIALQWLQLNYQRVII